ncbi:hypothetical protein [Intestinimonas massiliensis (ex Afouda et al. 2020)]|uniref:Uncharacterized protein n=1 Tax=Intestinimonas massiliensis (ex Afouda et al. 2020) TaxID=1673721 RepID=A0ABS9M429_9FIRM|nr:hypothetical protein [Intestinimonas massiliensis (ex Afouda et al. 2020)]MCG4525543.1 hypothetical protein [Intestinimonas massiliensis (ex Afouda et al. 2020)]
MTYRDIAKELKRRGEQEPYTRVLLLMLQEEYTTKKPLNWGDQAPDWIRGEVKA